MMRPALIIAVALMLMPAALTAHPAPGMHSHVTDISAAKRHKKAKAPKEEYLKAAPGTGPSGPEEIGRSAAERPDRDHHDHDRDELQQDAQPHQPLRGVGRAATHHVDEAENQHNRHRTDR